MKCSVGKKTFIGVMAVMLITSVLMLAGQMYLFPRYYTYVITENAKALLSDFSRDYSECADDEEVMDIMENYSKNCESYIAVMSADGELLHMLSYEMYIKTENGIERINLDNAIRSEQIYDMKLQKGDTVTVEYKRPKRSEEGSIYVPDKIINERGMWEKESFPDERTEDYKSGVIEGELVSVTLPEKPSFTVLSQRREAFGAVMDWRTRFVPADTEENSYSYNDGESGNPYLVTAGRGGTNGEYILVVSPLKAISEANEISKKMGGIWIAAGICVAAVTALIFSKTVSAPIVEMTAVTQKMRRLDFSEKCRVKSGDEIGRLAENINDMSERLDKTIAELSRANNKLKKDIEHERMLEEQRKEFVAAASHELKTPLAVIQAYTEGIMDGISGDNLEKYLKTIHDETNRMDRLVREMLENSKLEAGAQKPRLKEVNISELAENAAKIFAKSASDYEIEIEYNIPNKKIIKHCDYVMIERVVMNFMSNAIAHTPKNGKIAISVTEELVSVENEGKAIPEEDMKFVWDKFYKADKARTRIGGGTGLGLSIAKNILVLHGAEFGAENTASGVKFWFALK